LGGPSGIGRRASGVRRLRVAFGLAGALLAGACASPRISGGTAGLQPSPHPYDVDLPVPVGFRLVDQPGENPSSRSSRHLRHRYVGRADKCGVREFYRQQMPLVRWSALSDRQQDGRYTMRFKRGDESCTIEIRDSASRFFPRVTVDALISPWEQSD